MSVGMWSEDWRVCGKRMWTRSQRARRGREGGRERMEKRVVIPMAIGWKTKARQGERTAVIGRGIRACCREGRKGGREGEREGGREGSFST